MKIKPTIISTLIFLLLNTNFVFSQAKTAKFGFHLEPIFPTKLFRVTEEIVTLENLEITTIPKEGFLFGGHLAINLTKNFAIESGINIINRDFQITAEESEKISSLQFTVHNYEMPLALTYFVRLGEKLYMGHTAGISFQFLPSNLISRQLEFLQPGGEKFLFEQRSYRRRWILPSYKGSVGFEYRSENAGHFYIGPVYHLFTPLYHTLIIYQHGTIDEGVRVKPVGDFFGVVLRYSFNPSPLNFSKKNK